MLFLEFFQLLQLNNLFLLDLFQLYFLLLFVVGVAGSFETFNGSFADETVVGVEVEEGDFERGAHDEAIAQEVGLVDPEGWHGNSVSFAEEVEVRHLW